MANSMVRPSKGSQSEVIYVLVPKNMALVGNGFSFAVPQEVSNQLDVNAAVSVSTISGEALPAFLSYLPESKKFVASNVPGGAIPMSVLLNAGSRSWTVVITEKDQ